VYTRRLSVHEIRPIESVPVQDVHCSRTFRLQSQPKLRLVVNYDHWPIPVFPPIAVLARREHHWLKRTEYLGFDVVADYSGIEVEMIIHRLGVRGTAFGIRGN